MLPRLRMHTIALVYLYALLMAVALGWDAAVSDAPATKGPGWVFVAALFVMVATAVSMFIGNHGPEQERA